MYEDPTDQHLRYMVSRLYTSLITLHAAVEAIAINHEAIIKPLLHLTERDEKKIQVTDHLTSIKALLSESGTDLKEVHDALISYASRKEGNHSGES